MMWKSITLLFLAAVFLTSCQAATIQIPVLDTKGDVYKTEGANDTLIYDSTIGHKKVSCSMLTFRTL
jgi:hypothetical protein